MKSGLTYALERAFDRFVVQPRRLKAWERKSGLFDYKNSDGLRFRLDSREYIDKEIYCNGVYERRFLEFVRSGLTADSIALDIGANIGNHAIYLAQFINAVHSFEPNPTIIPRLEANVSMNRLKGKVVVHPVGLGKTSETLTFRDNNDGNLGGSGFLKPGETPGETDRVHSLNVEAGDDYIEKIGLSRVDFIKMDVEGWEPDVFEGLTNTIARYRPVVAFEFHGQLAAKDDFSRIAATLPDYVFAERVTRSHSRISQR